MPAKMEQKRRKERKREREERREGEKKADGDPSRLQEGHQGLWGFAIFHKGRLERDIEREGEKERNGGRRRQWRGCRTAKIKLAVAAGSKSGRPIPVHHFFFNAMHSKADSKIWSKFIAVGFNMH